MDKKTIAYIAVFVLLWRAFLFSIPLFSNNIVKNRAGYDYTRFAYIYPAKTKIDAIFTQWGNFDGVHYMNIALKGYSDNNRFLPLFPIVLSATIRLWQYIIGTPPPIAVLGSALVFIIMFGSLTLLYKLLRNNYTKKQSYTVIALLLAFPTSFFFAAIYSEGLFLLLAAASLIAAQKNKWMLAGVLSLLLGITRLPGILILLPLFAEWYTNPNKKISQLIWLFPALIGIGGYALYNFLHWGNMLSFVYAHSSLGNSRSTTEIIFPLQTVYRYMRILTSVYPLQYEWFVAFFELLSFFFALIATAMLWKYKVRTSYKVYAIALLSLPLLSGTFSGFPRYIIIAFPLWLPIALTNKSWVRIIYAGLCIPFLILFTMLFAHGYFIA